MKKSDTRFIVYLVKILKGVWFEKKCGIFNIYFQLFVGPTTKNTSLVVFCTQFSFSAFKKQHTMFGRFHFLENEYRGIFVKKTISWVPLTVSCPIKSSLSLNDGGGQSMRVIHGWCSLVVDSFWVWWFFCGLVCWNGYGGCLF